MKALRVAFLVMAAILVPACFYDTAIGVRPDPQHPGQVTVDPSGGPAGQIIQTAQGALPFIPQPWGGIATIGLMGASAILHILQNARKREWKSAALSAAQGVQDVVHRWDTLPSPSPIHPADAADQVKAALDNAIHANVPQEIKSLIIPKT